MNNAFPEGAIIMAEGMVPVATPLPFVAIVPLLRSMLKAETKESPCVLRNRAPVPEDVDEVLELQPIKQSSQTAPSHRARTRHRIPILSPCYHAVPIRRGLAMPADSRSKTTSICVSGISGKSKPHCVIGIRAPEESCPAHF